MYAGIDYDEDDEVTPGDLVVPYLDMPWHNEAADDEELGFLWNEYVVAVGRCGVACRFVRMPHLFDVCLSSQRVLHMQVLVG